jgi:predicted P-loop ATPase
MSQFQHPSSSDRQAAGTDSGRKRKAKSKIDASTEVIPTFWFHPGQTPYWSPTPTDQALLDKLATRPIEPGILKEFCTCPSITSHMHTGKLMEATPVYMPGGALAFIELRWRAPDDERGRKRFAVAFRAYDCDKEHMNEMTGERLPFVCGRWSHLFENEAGLLLPIGAKELKDACDNATGAKIVAWYLCEGVHSMKGVRARLEDPAVAHIVEKWKRDNGVSEIVVGAWVCGLGGGAARTNFGMQARNDMQVVGQNDWKVDFSNIGPIGRVVIVPDTDKPGYKEKETVANRLRDDFKCSETKIYEVAPPPGLSRKEMDKGWDDYNELPVDVTREDRVEQLLNPKEWTPEPYIRDAKSNKVILNAENVHIAIGRQRMDELFYFDDFRNAPMINGPLPNFDRGPYPRGLDDDDVLKFMAHMQHVVDFEKVGESMARHGIMLQANDHHVHPIREYLEGLTWDHKPRVDTIFSDYLKAENNEGNRLAAGILLKSMVARVLYPGCTAQYVITLIGQQDIFKSEFCKRLATKPYFSDCLPRLDHKTQLKEAQAHLAGHWLLEIAENASFKNAESETLKSFITMEDDIYCAKYAHLDKRHPRQCIFIITTNEEELFKDRTGNRRYLPVEVAVTGTPTIEDMERFDENRDQIFAEAYSRVVDMEEKWHPTREQQELLLKPRQAAHRATEPWEEQFLYDIREALERENVLIWPRDLLTYFLDRKTRFGKLVKKEEYAAVLRGKGWTNKKNRFTKVWDKKKGEAVSSDNTHCCWSHAGYGGKAIERALAYAKGGLDEPGMWVMDGTWKRPTPPEAGGDGPEDDFDAPKKTRWEELDEEDKRRRDAA